MQQKIATELLYTMPPVLELKQFHNGGYSLLIMAQVHSHSKPTDRFYYPDGKTL